jgi:hypothetical protein
VRAEYPASRLVAVPFLPTTSQPSSMPLSGGSSVKSSGASRDWVGSAGSARSAV